MGLLTPSRGVWGLGALWGLGVQTHPGTTARPCIGDRGHPKGLSPRGNVPQGCTHQQYGVHAEGGGVLGVPSWRGTGLSTLQDGPLP